MHALEPVVKPADRDRAHHWPPRFRVVIEKVREAINRRRERGGFGKAVYISQSVSQSVGKAGDFLALSAD